MEDGQDTNVHIELVKCILALYDKAAGMVKFLVDDNCATNHAMATKLGVLLVGCASHRFTLTVNRVLAEHQDLVDDMQALSVQLRFPNNLNELARYTALRLLKTNAIRWTSVFAMLNRYVAIRAASENGHRCRRLRPRATVHNQIVGMRERLKELGNVCVRLQEESRTLADGRLLFNACVDKYNVMAEHLALT